MTLEQIQSRLYPCPFCGSLDLEIGTHVDFFPDHSQDLETFIRCITCEARGGPISIRINSDKSNYTEDLVLNMSKRVAALWNHRVVFN